MFNNLDNRIFAQDSICHFRNIGQKTQKLDSYL
jgi:hypothetical protein